MINDIQISIGKPHILGISANNALPVFKHLALIHVEKTIIVDGTSCIIKTFFNKRLFYDMDRVGD